MSIGSIPYRMNRIYMYICMICFVISSVNAFNIISDTPTTAYSTTLNYESILLQTNGSVTSQLVNSMDDAKTPQHCDIDGDGRVEIISYVGNSITISGYDETGFIEEHQFSLTPNQSIDSDINWLTCVHDEQFSDLYQLEGATYIVLSQGTESEDNEITFIGYEPDMQRTPIPDRAILGKGYTIMYWYENQTHTGDAISCDTFEQEINDTIQNRMICMTHNGTHAFPIRLKATLTEDSSTINGEFEYFAYPGWYDSSPTGSLVYTLSESIGTARSWEVGGEEFVVIATGNSYLDFALWGFETTGNRYAIGGNAVTDFDTESYTIPMTFTSPSFIYLYSRAWGAQMLPSDITNDGVTDICAYGSTTPGINAKYAHFSCFTASGSQVYKNEIGSGENSFTALTTYDIDNDGVREVFVYRHDDGGTSSQIKVFGSSISLPTLSTSSVSIPPDRMSITRVSETDAVYDILFGKNILRLNMTNESSITTTLTSLSSLQSGSESYFFDVNGDYRTEILTIVGTTYTTYGYSALPVIASTTLVDTSRYASGFFGFDPQTCQASNLTIQATECTTSATSSCTYTNSIAFEKERICTNCGGESIICGAWSFASPIVRCESIPSGTFAVSVYLETESKPTLVQSATSFLVNTSTDVTCNTNILTSPATFVGISPIIPDGDDETTTQQSQFEIWYDDWKSFLDESIPPAIQLILSIIIIMAFAVGLHKETNGNTYMTIMGSLFGAGVAVALTLLPIEIVLIVGIGLIIFLFVSQKFDKHGGG